MIEFSRSVKTRRQATRVSRSVSSPRVNWMFVKSFATKFVQEIRVRFLYFLGKELTWRGLWQNLDSVIFCFVCTDHNIHVLDTVDI